MGRIPDEVVDQIREGLPIEDVIGEFVPLRKAGTNFKGLCPFHEEKTPSFNVNPRMGIFKCFGCGAGGNVISFIMRHEGMTFREGLEYLARRQGIDLSRYDDDAGAPARQGARERILAVNRLAAEFFRVALGSAPGRRGRDYLAGRGVGTEAAEAFSLGYVPPRWDALTKALGGRGVSPADLAEAGLVVQREDGSGCYDRFRDRIMFPIFGSGGEVIAFGGRSLPDSESRHATAKYVNSPDTAVFRKGRVLYGLWQGREAIREEKRALVTEGYFDVIALWQHGFRAAVAPLGTALTAEHLRGLRAHAEELVFVFDPDRAGQAASERAGAMAGRLLGLAGAPDALVAGDVLRRDFIDRDGLGAVRLRVVSLPGGRDVDEVLREEGAGAFAALLEGAEGLLDHTVRAAVGEAGAAAAQGDKMAAVQRLLPVLGACHPSVRDQYFALLEDRLGIPYPTLAGMVKRLLAGQEREREAAARRPGPVNLLGEGAGWPRAERDAIQILLGRPELAALEAVTPALFSSPPAREIVGALQAEARRGRAPAPGALADRLEDEAARALVVELAARECVGEEAEEELIDCLGRLKERQRRRREEALLKAIEQARREEGGDSPRMWRLMEEKNALLRERQRLASPR